MMGNEGNNIGVGLGRLLLEAAELLGNPQIDNIIPPNACDVWTTIAKAAADPNRVDLGPRLVGDF